MSKFIGRKNEVQKLLKLFNKKEFQTVLIYGRRRIGKSELIKHTLSQSKLDNIYFECKETTEINNVKSICELISEKFNIPSPSFSSIEEVLEYINSLSINKPFVFVFDEYPYLRNAVKGIDSIIQSFIDKYSKKTQLKIMLCGSYIDVMKSLLEKENPLFGRIDLAIKLGPMNYLESSEFYPTFSNEDKVKLYSVFGGVPYYNKLINPELDVEKNISELIASEDARLINEVPMNLKLEISRIINANEVFETLSLGYSKFSDILSQSHVSSSPALADALEKLIKMELVEKEVPINDRNNKRKSRYNISDNLALFYYRYIYKHMSQLNIMNPKSFYKKYIEKDFEEKYVPHIFEDICKQYLISKNREGKMKTEFFDIGKYWYDDSINHTNGEFDIVTEDEFGYIFYDAKFRKKAISKNIINEEISQVDATGLNCYKYGFISRSGFSIEPQDNMIFINLNELYKV